MAADAPSQPIDALSAQAAEQARHRAWLIRIVILLVCYVLVLVYTIRWTRDAFGYTWDFSIYYNKTLAAQAGQSPYFPYFVTSSFLYHPAVLSFLSLFTLVPLQVGYVIWTIASIAAYGATILIILRLYTQDRPLPHEQLVFLVVLLAGFGPMWEATHLGQINAFATLCLALSLYSSENDRYLQSGVFLGLAILLKLSPVLFVLYFLVLRRYRVIAAAAVTVVIFSLFALLQYGTSVFADFFSILPRLAGETHAGYLLDLSAPIVTSRILELFQITNVETAVAFVYKVIFGCCILAILAYTWRTTQTRASRFWLFGIFTVFMIIVSPVVWFHHNVFLIIPLTLLLADQFNWALAIMLLLQSERLIYNVAVAQIGFATDRMSAAIALTAGVPTVLAQLALLVAMVWVYRRVTSQEAVLQPVSLTGGAKT